MIRFDWRPAVRELVKQRSEGTAVPELAARFMNTLVRMGTEQVRYATEITGIRRIVLSGGSFQSQTGGQTNRLPRRKVLSYQICGTAAQLI